MSPSVHTIEFASFWDLLDRLSDEARGLIIADGHGEHLWLSHDLAVPAADELIKSVMEAGCDRLNKGKILIARSNETEIASTGVLHDDGTLLCTIIAIAGKDSAPDKAQSKLVEALSTIRRFLSRELQLTYDLDLVSAELGDRYEELNLLYNTEEDIQNLDDPAIAIGHLIAKTNLHLNVDAIILGIPQKNINVTHIESRFKIAESRLAEISAELIQNVMDTGLSISVNDSLDSDRGARHQRFGIKCLATPLFDSRGIVEGALIATNNPSARSFSNSDRNLMEVMAQRVRVVLDSTNDTLTGLLARHAFEQRLKAANVMSRATKVTCAVLYINIDRLHVINDICGPHAGDAVIRSVASVFQEMLQGENIAARIGGDEFGVFINNCSIKDAMTFANTVCQRVADLDFEWDGTVYELSVSIGIGTITATTTNIDEVLSAAEIACGEAKEAGGGRTRVLREHDTVLVMRQNQMKWIGRVQAALRESRFELYAQAIQPLNADSQSVHHEILVRLLGEQGQIVLPNEFLPSAERYNLMPAIDRWVMENVFGRLATHWKQLDAEVQERERNHCLWAINLSGQSLCDARLLHFVLERIEHYKLPCEMLCFEITESAAVRNIGDARRLIAALKSRGCKFSLDDFGTGVSSFAYLKNLPVDYLKIDGSFVRPLLEDATSDAVVSAISQIADAMGLRTIAEFVETAAIADRLREIGIDFAQGYAFARPVKLTEVLEHRSSIVLAEPS